MTISQTSLSAYSDARPILNILQRRIYAHLCACGASCIADIATDLQLERSTVSGRLNELHTLGATEIVIGRSRTTGRQAQMHIPMGVE